MDPAESLLRDPMSMTLFSSRSSDDTSLQPAAPGEDREIPVRREELVLQSAPDSHTSEQVRRLRNSLQALNPDGASRSILVTSSIEGEGKTVGTLNLALALAELPQLKVLVLDADFRNPGVERYLGLPRRQGFTEVLQSRLKLDQAIRSTSVPHLDIVGAGEQPLNPAELLNLDRVRAVLNAVKRRYDYVLVDSPAVLSLNHPSVLGTVVDGILMVVRLGMTPKPMVEEAYGMLETMGGNVLGTYLTGSQARF